MEIPIPRLPPSAGPRPAPPIPAMGDSGKRSKQQFSLEDGNGAENGDGAPADINDTAGGGETAGEAAEPPPDRDPDSAIDITI